MSFTGNAEGVMARAVRNSSGKIGEKGATKAASRLRVRRLD